MDAKNILLSVGLAAILFIAAMIDMRGREISGTCVVNGFSISPVINHDCKGKFYEQVD